MEGAVDHARRDPDVVDLSADPRKGSGSAGDGRGERPRRHRVRLGLDLPVGQHERRMAELIGGQDVDARHPSLPGRGPARHLQAEQHCRDIGHTTMASVIHLGRHHRRTEPQRPPLLGPAPRADADAIDTAPVTTTSPATTKPPSKSPPAWMLRPPPSKVLKRVQGKPDPTQVVFVADGAGTVRLTLVKRLGCYPPLRCPLAAQALGQSEQMHPPLPTAMAIIAVRVR
jgi:hypothetical protein